MTPEQQKQIESSNPLRVMRDNEQIIFELKRHPIGILLIYVMTGIVLLVTAIAVFGLAPSFVSNSSGKDQILNFTYIGFAVFALLCLLFAWVSTVVYWGNRWILSDDSITQTTQNPITQLVIRICLS